MRKLILFIIALLGLIFDFYLLWEYSPHNELLLIAWIFVAIVLGLLAFDFTQKE